MVMKQTAVMERRDRNGCERRKDNKARDSESSIALVFQLIRQVYEQEGKGRGEDDGGRRTE